MVLNQLDDTSKVHLSPVRAPGSFLYPGHEVCAARLSRRRCLHRPASVDSTPSNRHVAGAHMRSTRWGLPPWFVLCGALLSVTACGEDSHAPPSRAEPRPELMSTDEPGNLAPLDLVYVCGNKFLATNSFRR